MHLVRNGMSVKCVHCKEVQMGCVCTARVAIAWKDSHQKRQRSMHHTSSRPSPHQTARTTLGIHSVPTELIALHSISPVLREVVSIAVQTCEGRKLMTQTGPSSWASLRHSTKMKKRLTNIILIDIMYSLPRSRGFAGRLRYRVYLALILNR